MIEKTSHNCPSIDELLEQTKLNITKYGHQVIMVNSTEYSPSFAYSIGLKRTFDHPEIICFGLPNYLGHAIINDVAKLIEKDKSVLIGQVDTEIFKDSRAVFLEVDRRNINDYFRVALNYYGDEEFAALQLVWTDRNDKFPWEENFEKEFLSKQPLLDRNAEFKFNEPFNLTTFTTRQWFEENSPILSVSHDTDGYWQFLTGDQMPEDIRVVALKEIVERDKTLNEVFDLEYGEWAERDFVGGNWTRSRIEDDDQE